MASIMSQDLNLARERDLYLIHLIHPCDAAYSIRLTWLQSELPPASSCCV